MYTPELVFYQRKMERQVESGCMRRCSGSLTKSLDYQII